MKHSRRADCISTFVLGAITLITSVPSAADEAKTGALRGTVVTVDSDGARSVVAGAKVSIEGPSLSRTTADEQGKYSFPEAVPGRYRIEAIAPGLSGRNEATVVAGTAIDVEVELKMEAVKESVTVETASDPATTQQSTIDKAVVLNAPNKDDRIDTLLPLIPGVVRGPDGLINMKGARASQGGALVNSANVTDPATGNAAMSLPIDVVQSVMVIANPYDPEYGRLTGAVASLDTVSGNFNAFHLTMQNLFVRPRKRDGDFIGVESATPRMTVTGPLIKNKIAFTQSLEYRFIRTPVSSLPQLERDMKLEGFNSFSQLDV